MGNWQITAMTIYCEAVDDEITLLVSHDFSTRCTGHQKYSQPNAITRKLVRQKARRFKRPLRCEGETCLRVREYQEKIRKEAQA